MPPQPGRRKPEEKPLKSGAAGAEQSPPPTGTEPAEGPPGDRTRTPPGTASGVPARKTGARPTGFGEAPSAVGAAGDLVGGALGQAAPASRLVIGGAAGEAAGDAAGHKGPQNDGQAADGENGAAKKKRRRTRSSKRPPPEPEPAPAPARHEGQRQEGQEGRQEDPLGRGEGGRRQGQVHRGPGHRPADPAPDHPRLPAPPDGAGDLGHRQPDRDPAGQRIADAKIAQYIPKGWQEVLKRAADSEAEQPDYATVPWTILAASSRSRPTSGAAARTDNVGADPARDGDGNGGGGGPGTDGAMVATPAGAGPGPVTKARSPARAARPRSGRHRLAPPAGNTRPRRWAGAGAPHAQVNGNYNSGHPKGSDACGAYRCLTSTWNN